MVEGEQVVWIVEDNEANKILMERFVRLFGINVLVESFVHPNEVEERLEKNGGIGPDLMILDYEFDGEVGVTLGLIGVFEKMCEVNDECVGPMIVMWSALHDAGELERVVRDHEVVHERILSKPINGDELFSALQEYGVLVKSTT